MRELMSVPPIQRVNIKQAVSYLEISSFSTLVNRCRIFKDNIEARYTQWRQAGPMTHEK